MSSQNINLLNSMHEQLISCETEIEKLLSLFSDNKFSQSSSFELYKLEEQLNMLSDGFNQYVKISLSKIDDMKNNSITEKRKSSVNSFSFSVLENFDSIVKSKSINVPEKEITSSSEKQDVETIIDTIDVKAFQ